MDCAAEVVAATLNGGVSSRRPRVGSGCLTWRRATRCGWRRCRRTRPPARACTRRWIRPTARCTCGCRFEPDEARYVWACFDQPDLKAPHAFTVTAPAGWTVTSNSGGPRVEPVGSARRWTFPDTPPLSTYNTVVNAGPVPRDPPRGRRTTTSACTRAGRWSAVLERDAEEIFTLTEQGLGFFGSAFGMPFPQRTYDQVFMPEFGGAMENYGCVTWSDWFLRRSAPTPAERELLRQGPAARDGAHVVRQHRHDALVGRPVAQRGVRRVRRALGRRSGRPPTPTRGPGTSPPASSPPTWPTRDPTSHPIRQPIPDVAEAASIFDAITYPKGASVLRQLMAYVGEANVHRPA